MGCCWSDNENTTNITKWREEEKEQPGGVGVGVLGGEEGCGENVTGGSTFIGVVLKAAATTGGGAAASAASAASRAGEEVATAKPKKPKEKVMPDPALLKKIDAVLPKLFAKYDVNQSGTLDEITELMQITVNMTYQLDVPMCADDVDEIKQMCIDVGVGKPWAMAEFRNWYFNTAIPVYLTNQQARAEEQQEQPQPG